jgi:AcrR family transcriptional regulator
MTKGDDTRERILVCALRLASREGLEGVSIGGLAGELGLSKSGLFAHFGSKEDLQLAVLQRAAERFEALVMKPAFRATRGAPRVRALFEHWLRWLDDGSSPGGCLFVAAATELDDKEGRPRDFLVAGQRQLMAALARSAKLAVAEGHFRKDLDCDGFAFELQGLLLAHSYFHRLLRDPRTERRTRTAFERLLASAQAPS